MVGKEGEAAGGRPTRYIAIDREGGRFPPPQRTAKTRMKWTFPPGDKPSPGSR